MTKPIIVVGMGFGDEGKGATVDRLCTQNPNSLVIRYNGGCQAAHNVVRDNGTHHTFAQFGSGTLAGSHTFLSRFMMVEPFSLLNEAEHLKQIGIDDPLSMLSIDGECLLTTPYHWLTNQYLERSREKQPHGSCGRGIGMTAEYALNFPDKAPRMKHLLDATELAWRLMELEYFARRTTGEELPMWREVFDQYEKVAEVTQRLTVGLRECLSLNKVLGFDDKALIFEGSQGVLLDEWYGFHPHTTWSTTTTANAEKLLQECGYKREEYTKLGVIRSYHTRHGNGPFPSERKHGLLAYTEAHNEKGEWSGPWRVGTFDDVLFKYALKVTNGIDQIALTHMEHIKNTTRCSGYEVGGTVVEELPVSPKPDLRWQEGLTSMLETAQPVHAHALWENRIQSGRLHDVSIHSIAVGPKTSDVEKVAEYV